MISLSVLNLCVQGPPSLWKTERPCGHRGLNAIYQTLENLVSGHCKSDMHYYHLSPLVFFMETQMPP